MANNTSSNREGTGATEVDRETKAQVVKSIREANIEDLGSILRQGRRTNLQGHSHTVHSVAIEGDTVVSGSVGFGLRGDFSLSLSSSPIGLCCSLVQGVV